MLKKCFFVTVAAAAALVVALSNAPAPPETASVEAQLDTAAPLAEAAPGAEAVEQARSAMFRRTMHFEPNLGQAPDDVEFAARGMGYGVFIEGPSAVLALQPGDGEASAYVRVRFDGGADDAVGEPLDASSGRSHYMTGPESTWVRNVPRYASVHYAEVYAGVDVRYYGNQRRLEYDCIVAPGADPDQIRIAIEGTDGVTLADNGELRLALPGGDVVQHVPIAYQERDGQREPVDAEYRIEDDGRVAFDLGPYDRSVALVIDPVIAYATYIGGPANERFGDIDVDAEGQAYIVGTTPDFSANFTIRGSLRMTQTSGGFITPSGDGDGDSVLVAKFLPDGSDVVYSTLIGGGSQDIGLGIAIDTEGNAYVTGWTQSFDYPVSGNAFQQDHGDLNFGGEPNIDAPDAFLTELNATGNGLVYSTFLGGSQPDIGFGVDVDSSGNIYVVGGTGSFNFPVNFTAARPFYTGGNLPGNGDGDGDGDGDEIEEGFVTKFGPAGSSLVYSTFITGSTGIESCADVIGNDAGEATVVGSTSSFDFLTDSDKFKTANGVIVESFDAFVLRLNALGSSFEFAETLGGDGDDFGTGLGLDAADNVYICGSAGNETNFELLNPLRSAFETSSNNGPNGITFGEGFVAKYVQVPDEAVTVGIGLDGEGNNRQLAYSTFIGGAGDDMLLGMDVSAAGAATVIGTTGSLDLQLVDAIPDLDPVNNTSMAFLATLTSSGNALTMQTYLGGSENDWGSGVVLGPNGSIFCTGFTSSEDFPVTSGAFQTSITGGLSDGDGEPNSDYYVVRLDPTPVVESPTGLLFIKRIRIKADGPFGPIVKANGFVDTGLPLKTLKTRLPRAPQLDPPPPFKIYPLNATVQMGPAVFGVPFFFEDTIRVPRNHPKFSPLRKNENFRIFFSDLTLQTPTNVLVELKAHRLDLSARARFRLIFHGDITPAVFPGSNFTIRITTPAFDALGTATLDDGRSFDFSRRPGAIVAPDFVVRRLKSNLRPRPGGDKFSFVAAFAHDGAPSSAPDLRIGFGAAFDTTVPGSQFRPRGRNRFVFRGNSGGIRTAEVDYDRNTIRVTGSGLNLGGFGEFNEEGPKVVSAPVQLLVGLDDDVRSIIVLAARTVDKIRY